jgi:OOP family OmpA-OmpF porin
MRAITAKRGTVGKAQASHSGMKKLNSCRTRVCCVAALATIAWSASASAQTVVTTPGALNRFEPSERGSDWFANESLDLRGSFRPAIGIVGDYGYKGYTLENPDGTENTAVISSQFYLHVGASVNLFDRLRLGVSLPLALLQDGESKTAAGRRYIAPSSGGVGDLRLAADLRLLGAYGDPFTLALGGRLWLPTGDETQYIGDGQVRVGPHVAVAGDIDAFAYSAAIGTVYRANDTAFVGHPNGTELDFSAAAGLRVADKKLLLGPELFGSTVISNGDAVFRKHSTPLAMIVGGHYNASGFRFGLGAGPGLSKTAGTAQFRALASIEWMPEIEKPLPPRSDRDGDGVFDNEDACPDVAGVHTNDPKTNGCPPDRDGDGILDQNDACPDVPGIKTDDPKTNGCPSDRDHDGIPDAEDACPDVAGIKTDDPKTNGCPSDQDKDGIIDAEDACPTVPGVKTDDPKTNGCPSDRDKDGIPDTIDACPDAAGPHNDNPKMNGCPFVRIEAGQVKILEQIKFKTNSAEIVESKNILDAVATTLKEHPEIKHLRVEGHTDNVGKPVYNKDLSRRRAASVERALIKAGVDKRKLSSEGFGLERPLEDNATAEGRTANRRVEFHIEDLATNPVPAKTQTPVKK